MVGSRGVCRAPVFAQSCGTEIRIVGPRPLPAAPPTRVASTPALPDLLRQRPGAERLSPPPKTRIRDVGNGSRAVAKPHTGRYVVPLFHSWSSRHVGRFPPP